MSGFNPTTVNEKLFAVTKTVFPLGPEKAIEDLRKVIPTKPLLTYNFSDFTEEELKKYLPNITAMDKVMDTPYKEFRYYARLKLAKITGYVLRVSDKQLLIFNWFENPVTGESFQIKIHLKPSPKPDEAEWMSRVYTEKGLEITPSGDNLLPPPIQDYIDHIVVQNINVVAALSEEYLRSDNFIARVTPDKPGKSVEWKKAREHLVIINRRHPANNKQVKSGAVIPIDENREIKRTAHSRRGHYRTLRSLRFRRDPDGNVIKRKIEATWVGPKEWKDTAAQIYQIIPPLSSK